MSVSRKSESEKRVEIFILLIFTVLKEYSEYVSVTENICTQCANITMALSQFLTSPMVPLVLNIR